MLNGRLAGCTSSGKHYYFLTELASVDYVLLQMDLGDCFKMDPACALSPLASAKKASSTLV
jgi:hypothetical protein